MKILVTTPTFLPAVGGAEVGIHEIYDRLGRDHDVTILAPAPGDGTPYAESDHSSENYRVARLLPELDSGVPAVVRRGARRSSGGYLFEFSRVMRQLQPDVMNPHFLMRQAFPSLLAGRAHGVPVVLSLVGRPDVIHRLPFGRRVAARKAIAQVDSLISISKYCLLGEPEADTATIIPYGVNLNEYHPGARSDAVRTKLGLERDDIAVLTVQRLTAVKRVDVLVYMLAKALVAEPRLVLVVVGKGEELEPLKSLAESLGIGSRVRFTGYAADEDLPGIYASCDLFAFHSLSETFGIVLAQAMAVRLPIVAADTSCIAEVAGLSSGALVPPFDIERMADEVVSLAADPESRRAIGVANEARARQRFNWDEIAASYERVLAAAASRSKR